MIRAVVPRGLRFRLLREGKVGMDRAHVLAQLRGGVDEAIRQDIEGAESVEIRSRGQNDHAKLPEPPTEILADSSHDFRSGLSDARGIEEDHVGTRLLDAGDETLEASAFTVGHDLYVPQLLFENGLHDVIYSRLFVSHENLSDSAHSFTSSGRTLRYTLLSLLIFCNTGGERKGSTFYLPKVEPSCTKFKFIS